MKEKIAEIIAKALNKPEAEIINLIEIPPNPELGDYAFPCFQLAKDLKKNPVEIAKDLAQKLKSKDFEKVQAQGPYVNFFLSTNVIGNTLIHEISKKKEKYGLGNSAKGERIVLDLSAPNIAKPFGIGHLRSTIIGRSIANISRAQGAKVTTINYLGDWGTQFGKLIAIFKDIGNEKELKKDPINYLYSLYVKANSDESYEEKGRNWFVKLEKGDKDALKLWKQFKELSLKDFNEIYKLLDVSFDVTSGESEYNQKLDSIVSELKKKNLLVQSEGALVVDLKPENLGVCLIQKTDGATLYATRDIAAAIDRQKKFKATKLFYEVGIEQQLHFKQFFSVLSKMGYGWAKNCKHIAHGLYLDSDGKKFSTRKGKTVFMKDVLKEAVDLAKQEISKREPAISQNELASRAIAIARAAIIYGDLKSFREHSAVFDIDQFISFEGNTGPYLLYSYARAKNILGKAEKDKAHTKKFDFTNNEKPLLLHLQAFPEVVTRAYLELAPNLISNYAYELAQLFNEFYHKTPVIGSDRQSSLLALVSATAQVLKNSLNLLGIQTLERM